MKKRSGRIASCDAESVSAETCFSEKAARPTDITPSEFEKLGYRHNESSNDPIPKEGQERCSRPAEHQKMVDEAIAAAGLTGMPLAVAQSGRHFMTFVVCEKCINRLRAVRAGVPSQRDLHRGRAARGPERFLALNKELSTIWPNIKTMKPAPADAAQWMDVPGKRKLLER